jgi:nicotinamidase-related amidase
VTGLSLNPLSTALVIIDLQNGICAMPSAPHAAAEVVERCSALARKLRAGGGLVVRVRVGFAADYADVLRQPVDQSVQRPEGGLPADWTDFVPGLSVESSDLIILKRQWGAVYGTELELQLRRRGIVSVIIGGISTNFGVESTARDLWERGYAMIFAEDAMASRTEEMHRFPVEFIFPRLGRVRSTQEILAALG